MLNGIIKRRTAEAIEIDPLDLLASAESGESRESVCEQLQSPSRRSRFALLFFIQTKRVNEFVIARDSAGSEFVMLAQLNPSTRVFSIFLHKRSDECRPDFKLTWSADVQTWKATVEAEGVKCETCLYARRTPSIVERKPEFIEIKQGVEEGAGNRAHFYYMDVKGLSTELGEKVLECEKCQSLKAENLSPVNGSSTRTTPPPPFAEFFLHSFAGGSDECARNIHATTQGDDNVSETVFKFEMIEARLFKLEYRWPLSVAQAFCMALSTHFWT
jgi:hypothetical protein